MQVLSLLYESTNFFAQIAQQRTDNYAENNK